MSDLSPRSTDALVRLVKAAEGLAAALHRASTEHPKPAPCVAHKRFDDRADCPNCLALYEWEMAKRAYEDAHA